jgi:hypothetical protein
MGDMRDVYTKNQKIKYLFKELGVGGRILLKSI